MNLPSDDADFACLTLGRTNDDIDVSSETRQHAEKALGGKSAQLARDDERDLRRSVAHDVRGFSLRQFLILQDLRDFFGENFLGDHRLGDRPRAALRFSSGHGLLGKVNERVQRTLERFNLMTTRETRKGEMRILCGRATVFVADCVQLLRGEENS